MTRGRERFAIAGDWLAGSGEPCAWNNLGYWGDDIASGNNPYAEACERLLACHLEPLGPLSPDLPVLEVGCGYGASLPQWYAAGARHWRGLERRSSCLEYLSAHRGSSPRGLTVDARQGRFDQPLPSDWAPADCQAVVCVDAAYHARSFADFVAALSPALLPGGKLVITTLVRNSDQPLSRSLRAALALAGVPQASVPGPKAYQQVLVTHGLRLEQMSCLNDAVLGGFPRWVAHRRQYSRGTSPAASLFDMSKILATAQLCQRLYRDPQVSYSLMVAGMNGPE